MGENQIFGQNQSEKVVQLPWGSMHKIGEGVPTQKGSTGHTCRSRTTLPPLAMVNILSKIP